MNTRITFAVLLTILLFFTNCKKENNDIKAFNEVSNNIKNDSAHVFLKTLKPTQDDFNYLFIDKESSSKAFEYVDDKWDMVDNLRETYMRVPNLNEVTLKNYAFTNEDLKTNNLDGLSESLSVLSKYLKPEVVLYAYKYTKKDDPNATRERHCFFKIDDDRWVFAPLIQNAFKE